MFISSHHRRALAARMILLPLTSYITFLAYSIMFLYSYVHTCWPSTLRLSPLQYLARFLCRVSIRLSQWLHMSLVCDSVQCPQFKDVRVAKSLLINRKYSCRYRIPSLLLPRHGSGRPRCSKLFSDPVPLTGPWPRRLGLTCDAANPLIFRQRCRRGVQVP